MASTYLSLNVHLIFATHDRTPFIEESWRPDLHSYIAGTIQGLGAKPLAVGGVADHVHCLASLKATHSVADVVREVKKASSVWVAERQRAFRWQSGYAAFSVSPRAIEDVKEYIANQEDHHRKMTSADELRALLEEFAIEFKPEFFE